MAEITSLQMTLSEQAEYVTSFTNLSSTYGEVTAAVAHFKEKLDPLNTLYTPLNDLSATKLPALRAAINDLPKLSEFQAFFDEKKP